MHLPSASAPPQVQTHAQAHGPCYGSGGYVHAQIGRPCDELTAQAALAPPGRAGRGPSPECERPRENEREREGPGVAQRVLLRGDTLDLRPPPSSLSAALSPSPRVGLELDLGQVGSLQHYDRDVDLDVRHQDFAVDSTIAITTTTGAREAAAAAAARVLARIHAREDEWRAGSPAAQQQLHGQEYERIYEHNFERQHEHSRERTQEYKYEQDKPAMNAPAPGAYTLSSNPPNPKTSFRLGDWMCVLFRFVSSFSSLFLYSSRLALCVRDVCRVGVPRRRLSFPCHRLHACATCCHSLRLPPTHPSSNAHLRGSVAFVRLVRSSVGRRWLGGDRWPNPIVRRVR